MTYLWSCNVSTSYYCQEWVFIFKIKFGLQKIAFYSSNESFSVVIGINIAFTRQ